ncbi:hypothetical protein ACFQDD_06965 [Halorubrum pallidum]|uniref:Uncharacterized protein n=1 Tax=Halorubrum pallidum TaxID=1526114 RepID=A0ABD5T6S5_9EURY
MAPTEQATIDETEVMDPVARATKAVDVPDGWTATDTEGDQVVVWERAEGFPDLRENHPELRTTGWEIGIKCAEYGPDFAVIARPLCKALAFRSQTLLKTSEVEAAGREVSRFMRTVNATPNGWSLIETDGCERHRWMSWDGEEVVEVWQEDRNCGAPRTFGTTHSPAERTAFDGWEHVVEGVDLMDAVEAAADKLEDVDGYPEPKWEPTVEA